MRAARTGNNAQLDFRLTEFGVVCRDDEVAHHRQLAAAAECEAADRSDDGLANGPDDFPVARDVVALVGVHETELGHGTDVGPSGKRTLTAGDDHAADGVVGIEGLERSTEFGHERVVQRVEGFRAVQRDDADLAGFGADFDVFVAHGVSVGDEKLREKCCGSL